MKHLTVFKIILLFALTFFHSSCALFSGKSTTNQDGSTFDRKVIPHTNQRKPDLPKDRFDHFMPYEHTIFDSDFTTTTPVSTEMETGHTAGNELKSAVSARRPPMRVLYVKFEGIEARSEASLEGTKRFRLSVGDPLLVRVEDTWSYIPGRGWVETSFLSTSPIGRPKPHKIWQ